MTFMTGRFYRYRKALSSTSSSLRVGDVYRFESQKDYFPDPKIEFVLSDRVGEPYDLVCSYEMLDEVKLEEIFEEVPKPSWWDQPALAAAE